MIISTAALAYIIYTPFINSVLVAAVIFGIFNCYIYAGLLAYGTFQMKTPPPTLITTILLFGTTGTAISTTLGATILSISGSLSVVVHSVVLFYLISLILIILAVATSKEKEFILDK
jgi:TsgA-like MFS transporter